MAHDDECRCPACRPPGAATILPCDRELLAEEWLKGRGGSDGEVNKLRSGENGAPGSPRWISLQAIARARIAASDARAVLDRATKILGGQE